MEEDLRLVVKDTILAGVLGFIGIIIAKLLIYLIAIAFVLLILYALGYLKIDKGIRSELDKIRDIGLIPMLLIILSIFLAVMFPTEFIVAILGTMIVGAGLGYLGYNVL